MTRKFRMDCPHCNERIEAVCLPEEVAYEKGYIAGLAVARTVALRVGNPCAAELTRMITELEQKA